MMAAPAWMLEKWSVLPEQDDISSLKEDKKNSIATRSHLLLKLTISTYLLFCLSLKLTSRCLCPSRTKETYTTAHHTTAHRCVRSKAGNTLVMGLLRLPLPSNAKSSLCQRRYLNSSCHQMPLESSSLIPDRLLIFWYGKFISLAPSESNSF